MTQSKHHLFVGSYASKDTNGIYGYQFDSSTGELVQKSAYSGIESPSFLTVHPNGRWLYAASETGISSHGVHGAVYALAIEPGLDLKPLNQQSAKGDWTCHVELDRSGRWLIASNYGSGDAALYPILSDGRLGEPTAFVQHAGSGLNKDRQEAPHAHSAVFTSDNKYVIVADLGIDQLVMYSFDEQTGALTKHREVDANPGSGPRHFAIHSDGHTIYCANELDNSVTAYTYEPQVGTLKAQQTLSTLPDSSLESAVADIHISADGKHLYISNRGHNSIAVYKIEGDGRLNAPATFPSCGGNWPRNFALGPDGRFLLVANRRTNDLSALPIIQKNGNLNEKLNQASVSEPSCIKFI